MDTNDLMPVIVVVVVSALLVVLSMVGRGCNADLAAARSKFLTECVAASHAPLECNAAWQGVP